MSPIAGFLPSFRHDPRRRGLAQGLDLRCGFDAAVGDDLLEDADALMRCSSSALLAAYWAAFSAARLVSASSCFSRKVKKRRAM